MTDVLTDIERHGDRIRQLEINGPSASYGIQGWVPDNSELDVLVDFVIAMGCFDTRHAGNNFQGETLGPTGNWLREQFYTGGFIPDIQAIMAELHPEDTIEFGGETYPIAEAPAHLFDPNNNFYGGAVGGELLVFLAYVGALPNLGVLSSVIMSPSLTDTPPFPEGGNGWFSFPHATYLLGSTTNVRSKLLVVSGLPMMSGTAQKWQFFPGGQALVAEKAPHAAVPMGNPIPRPWRSGPGAENYAIPPGVYLAMPGSTSEVFWGLGFNGVYEDGGGHLQLCSDDPDYIGSLQRYRPGMPGLTVGPVVAQERCPNNPGGHVTAGATGVLGVAVYLQPQLSLAIPPIPVMQNDDGSFPSAVGGGTIPLDAAFDQPVWPGRAEMRDRIAAALPGAPALRSSIRERLPTREGAFVHRTFPHDDTWQACRVFEPWRGEVWVRILGGAVQFRGYVLTWGDETGSRALFQLPPSIPPPPQSGQENVRLHAPLPLGRLPHSPPVGWPYTKKFDVVNPRPATGMRLLTFIRLSIMGWCAFAAVNVAAPITTLEGSAFNLDGMTYLASDD